MTMTPLVFYGGKSRLVPHIVPLLPPHSRYVEVFAGGLALLLAKPVSPIEVVNDINQNLILFWRMLRDQGEELARLLTLTPYSSEEYLLCQHTWRDPSLPDVEKVRRWYTAIMQSFTREETRDSAWRRPYATQTKERVEVNVWSNRIDRLPQVIARLRRVALENRDFSEVLRDYDTPDTLFYCDPPYLPDSRSENDNYLFEMSEDQHTLLLELANTAKAQVIISGYPSPLYEQSLRSPTWERVEVERRAEIKNNSQEAGRRVEVIWLRRRSLPSLWPVAGCPNKWVD